MLVEVSIKVVAALATYLEEENMLLQVFSFVIFAQSSHVLQCQ